MIDISNYSDKEIEKYVTDNVLSIKKINTTNHIVYNEALFDKFYQELNEYVDNISKLNLKQRIDTIRSKEERLKINNPEKRNEYYNRLLNIENEKYESISNDFYMIISDKNIFSSYLQDSISPKCLNDYKNGVFIFKKNPILWGIIQKYTEIKSIELFVGYLNDNINNDFSFPLLFPIQEKSSELKWHKISQYLEFLKGRNPEYNRPILENESDYDILIKGVKYLVQQDKVKKIEKKICLNLHQNSIKQTFYTIHEELYGNERKIHDSFINFMHEYFENFKNTEISTLKTKFSVRSNKFPFNKNTQ